jgi:hypothetical protein
MAGDPVSCQGKVKDNSLLQEIVLVIHSHFFGAQRGPKKHKTESKRIS